MNGLRMIALLIAALPLPTSAEQPRTHMGLPIVNIEVRIAGGGSIFLPVTDAGPIPAENEAFRIETAGLAVQPSDADRSRRTVKWGFSLTAKSAQRLQRVVVEQVFPNETVERLIDDQVPVLRNHNWFGSPTIGPNSSSTSWLFTEGTSFFVFRFTITAPQQSPVILYQGAAFSPQVKEALRNAMGCPLNRFDGRFWTIANDASNEKRHLTEYVVPPEKIESWSELMTHTVHIRSDRVSLKAFVDIVRQGLAAECKDLRWTLLEQSVSEVLYEWSHGECPGSSELASFAQYEMSRVTLCRAGLCSWAYATRHVPVNTKQAGEWALILKKLDPEDVR